MAPTVRLHVVNISATTAHQLETGEADLALGFIPGLEAGFHEQRLYTQDFICLVIAQHPRIPRTIGQTLARMGSIRVFQCPVRVPTFTVKQYWHVRYRHDAGLRWLRGVCAQLFARTEPRPGKAQTA